MRLVPDKPTYTLANGTVLTLERVGPMIAAEIQAENPAPSPPLAPGFGGAMEPNPADPDYAEALAAHSARIGILLIDAYLDLGTSDDLEIDEAAVARVRAYQERRGKDISHMTDKVVYLKYVLVSEAGDLDALIGAIYRYDSPTEEQIAAAEAGFRGDVSRDRPAPDAPAPKRRAVQSTLGASTRE